VLAGMFTLDPSNGFPIGAPSGLPETVSVHGNLHGLGFMLSMVSWVALLVVLAIRHEKAGERGWAAPSVVAAVALLLTAACLGMPFGTLLLYVMLSGTWVFTGATMQHPRRSTSRGASATASRNLTSPASGQLPTPNWGCPRADADGCLGGLAPQWRERVNTPDR
jgi:hypothetical protein